VTSLAPVLHFMLAPEVTPEMLGRARPQIFGEEDWNHARRYLGPERADRRHYADDAARKERVGPFAELDAAIRHFLERPPQNDGAHRHPSLAAWHEARAALMNDPDAALPPI
jgi:hypothetical protein